MPSKWERFRATVALDLRSLAVLRILLGIMLLVDLGIRLVDLPDHYTDAGLLPRSVQQRVFFDQHPARFSFHMWSGDPPLQVLLSCLAACAAFAVIVGFRTRLALLSSVMLFISIQNRNLEIETGGDYLLRLACFWSLFLPLGARFSWDRYVGRVTATANGVLSNRYLSVASLAFLAQMMIVYLFSAIHKDHPIWREDFSAIHYALHIDAYDTALGTWLRQFRPVTGLLTRATLVFEYAAPWFLVGAGLLSLFPGFAKSFSEQAGARTVTVAAFSLFHLFLGMTISLGTFPWFAALVWFGFFPTEAWDRLSAWLDGDSSDQDDAAASAAEGVKQDESTRSAAERARFGRGSGPETVRQFLLRLRTWIRDHEAPLSPHPVGLVRTARLIAARSGDVLAALCALIVIVWNIGTVHGSALRALRGQGDVPLPDMTALVDLLRLDQHWGLFAPYPRTSDGYYVVLARLRDGTERDLLRPDFVLTWEKPADVSGSYKTFRWRKYFRNLRRDSKRLHRALYSNYVCHDYNRRHGADNPAERVEIYFMKRKTLRQGGHAPVVKQRIWRQPCPRPTGSSETN